VGADLEIPGQEVGYPGNSADHSGRHSQALPKGEVRNDRSILRPAAANSAAREAAMKCG